MFLYLTNGWVDANAIAILYVADHWGYAGGIMSPARVDFCPSKIITNLTLEMKPLQTNLSGNEANVMFRPARYKRVCRVVVLLHKSIAPRCNWVNHCQVTPVSLMLRHVSSHWLIWQVMSSWYFVWRTSRYLLWFCNNAAQSIVENWCHGICNHIKRSAMHRTSIKETLHALEAWRLMRYWIHDQQRSVKISKFNEQCSSMFLSLPWPTSSSHIRMVRRHW